MQKKQSKIKAVLYLRFSSESQTEQSIEGQRRDNTAFCERQGYDIVGEYIDRAKSATTDKRPDFQRMIRESKYKGFNAVIVWKQDRFARRRADAIKYKAVLKSNGVKVLSATESNVEGPDGIIMESVMEGLAEYYSADLAEKVQRGFRENVIKGKVLGGTRTFGYDVVDHHYVINPKEGPIVKEVFRLYVTEGYTMNAIVKRLKDNGMRWKDGREIQHSLIERMVANPKYIGILKCATEIGKDKVPRLIDDDTFEKAQKKRERHKHRGGSFKADVSYALSGRVFCGECGSILFGESGTSNTGKLHSYYTCKGKRRNKSCDFKSVKKEELEGKVIQSIFFMLKHPDILKALVDNIYKLQDRESPEESSIKERLKQVVKEIGNIMNAIKAGIFCDTTKEELLKLEGEKKSLDNSLSKVQHSYRKFTKEEIKAAIELTQDLPVETEIQRTSFVTRFVNRIDVYKDGRIIVKADLFGYDATALLAQTNNDNIIRIQPSFARHQHTI